MTKVIHTSLIPHRKMYGGKYCHLIYAVSSNEKTIVGFPCMIDCDPSQQIRLMPHEEVNFTHVLELARAIEEKLHYENPVLLLFKQKPFLHQKISACLNRLEPIQKIKRSEEVHALYLIQGNLLNAICNKTLENCNELLIADGHHRIEALSMIKCKYHRSSKASLSAVLFFTEEITFTGFQIEIKSLSEYDARALLRRFIHTKNINLIAPESKEWDYKIQYINNHYYYKLTFPPHENPLTYRYSFIRKWLSSQKKINEIHSALDSQHIVNMNLVFSVRTPSLQELFLMSKYALRLPEKSTYFYPKPLPELMKFIKDL